MCDILKDKIKDFLWSISEPLSPEALALVDQAKARMKIIFEHGFTQLYALAIDENGRAYDGEQQDVSIGQASTCAEIFAIAAARRRGAQLRFIVTVHHKREDQGGGVHVVTSCALCREKLLHFFPECKMVVWLRTELRLIPIQALLPVPYKTKSRPQNGGMAISEFDDAEAPMPTTAS